ncbi:MAG: hypothetical protein ACRDPT_01585 [Streptomycetales bacterium]
MPRRGAGSKPPLPQLASVVDRPGSTLHRLSAIDRHGRVADREVIQALGWPPGTRLDINERHGLVMVLADPVGAFRVTGQGRLHLPIRIQRWCGLKAGDRLLLSGDRTTGELVLCPPPALDDMVATYLAATLGGDH